MIPKPVYEILPGLYVVAAVITLIVTDSVIKFFPASLLLFTAALVVRMRYQFRHMDPRVKARILAQRYRDGNLHG